MIFLYLSLCMAAIWLTSRAIQSLFKITAGCQLSVLSAGLCATGFLTFSFGGMELMEPILVLISGLIFVPMSTILEASSK